MKKIFLTVFLLCSFALTCSAEEIIQGENENVSSVPSSNPITEYVPVITEPITTYRAPLEDYEISAFSVDGSAYNGSFNSTAYNYFQSILMKNVGVNYVAFRGSQYNYYLFYGDNLSLNGSTFSGSGLTSVLYRTQSGDNTVTINTNDSLSINAGTAFIYSNLGVNYGSFTEVEQAKYTKVLSLSVIALFGLYILAWIFKR